MTVTHTNALQQIARLWAERTAVAGGLLFADPLDASTTPANIYAKALPRLAHRLPLACSLTMDGAPQQSIRTLRAVVRCEAHADTLELARGLLADLTGVIRPGGEYFNPAGPFNDGATKTTGLLGITPIIAAAADGASIDLWRIFALDVSTNAQDLSPNLGPGATADGQASALQRLTALMHSTTIEAPTTAFDIVRVSGADTAAVEITATGIEITWTDTVFMTQEFTFSAYPTIGLMRAAIHAVSGWETQNIDASFDARDSRSVFASGISNALAGAVPARVWA